MAYELPVPRPGQKSGGIYSVGYNAWQGGKGLSGMFDALEAEGVTILVDTRNSDFRGRYSYDQLTQTAAERTGINGRPMRFAPRSALTGKPRQDEEYTSAGQADYAMMDTRPDATHVLNGMVEAAHKGERIALLCACADTCTCHRTRWLAESLAQRGVDVGHIEPGEFDRERYREEGVQELYRITPHSELPHLSSHSDVNWREQAERWNQPKEPQPIPKGYRSPQATKPIPTNPRQILIAGSMNANNAQLNYASALVVRAAEIGAQIHVGDNDQGVDARVVETANAIGYHDVVVWTAGGTPRNGGVEGGQVYQVPYNYKEQGNRYIQRDRTMIRGVDDEEGAAFFIDNGHTHHRNGRMTGTEAGYVFAVEHSKAARKVSFGRQQDREAELKPLPTTYVPQYRPQLPEFDPSLFEKPAPPINDPTPATSSLGEVDSAPQPPKPLTDVEKWGMALETAETLATEREHNAVYTRRPGHRTAEVLDMQVLPVTDQKGDSLGYAVAAVDVRWRATPFKLNTEDWRSADTVSVTEVAHFKHEHQAETYKEHLHGFMEVHDMTDDPAQRRDFLREVGQLNGLRAGIHTTDLIRMGATQLPDHRAEIGALQSGEWELKTVKLGFHPMDKDVPEPPPEPFYGFSIHAVQTVDTEGQHLGYSTVALRDVYENGLPIGNEITESYVMELARFEKQDDAKQYADGLMEYIKDKPGLEFIGSPENTAETHAFLEKAAQENGLLGKEQVIEREILFQEQTLTSLHNLEASVIHQRLFNIEGLDALTLE
ncbi:MAG: DUF488 domain-containing protein [Anaerolineae bacterium]|nr:DUF488 domain-containing protein [Anaerolineae bacterium]